jgi:hypothetical protein
MLSALDRAARTAEAREALVVIPSQFQVAAAGNQAREISSPIMLYNQL